MIEPGFTIYRLDAAAVTDSLARTTEVERHWITGILVIGGTLGGDPVALAICPDGSGILFDTAPDRDGFASNWTDTDFVADAGEGSA